jgi:hypothetical protein
MTTTVTKTEFNTNANKMKIEQWGVNKFLKLKPYSMNREVMFRTPKIKKKLMGGFIPTHSIVHVGKAMNSFGVYKKGDLFRLDGNTRSEIWNNHPELIPPIDLCVFVHEINSKEYGDNVYNSIDSMDSAETGSEKLTGFQRELGFIPKSDMFLKGKYKSLLELTCRWGVDSEVIDEKGKPLYLQTAGNPAQLKCFFGELQFLDSNESLHKHKKSSMNVNSSILLIAKKYGVNHPRLNLLVDNFVNAITTTNNQTQMDGVHYVINDLFTDNKEIWKYNGYSSYAKGLVPIICNVLYAFDCFMRNENLPKGKKIMSDKNLLDFWRDYNG